MNNANTREDCPVPVSETTRNPFRSGSPVKGAQFGDRVAETDYLVKAIARGQNVLVTSPRRFGKTSLLIRAAEQARQRDKARVAMVNLMYCSDRREIAEKITAAVIGDALGWLVGTSEEIRDRLSRLPGAAVTYEQSGVKVSLGLTRGADSKFLDEIRRPVELLADSAKDGRPVCLILDEFQKVAEIDADLAGVFKAITDDLPGVSLIFSGSRRHMIERIFTGSGAPLQNVAERLELPPISRDLMSEFLVARSSGAGRPLSLGAAHLIYDLMRGIPHFVQLLAATTFEQEGALDEAAVRRGLVEVLVHQRGELAFRYEKLSLVQQRLIRALGCAPVRDVFAKSFVQSLDAATSTVQRARDALEQTEHIAFDDRL